MNIKRGNKMIKKLLIINLVFTFILLITIIVGYKIISTHKVKQEKIYTVNIQSIMLKKQRELFKMVMAKKITNVQAKAKIKVFMTDIKKDLNKMTDNNGIILFNQAAVHESKQLDMTNKLINELQKQKVL
jgi:hypothetical protein